MRLKHFWVFLLLLTSVSGWAGERPSKYRILIPRVQIGFGVGVPPIGASALAWGSGKHLYGSMHWGSILDLSLESGTFFNGNFYSKDSLPYVAFIPGLRIPVGGFRFRVAQGVGYLARSDNTLARGVQFPTRLEIAFEANGKIRWSVHLGFFHISNADINFPNTGKDFLDVGWGMKL